MKRASDDSCATLSASEMSANQSTGSMRNHEATRLVEAGWTSTQAYHACGDASTANSHAGGKTSESQLQGSSDSITAAGGPKSRRRWCLFLAGLAHSHVSAAPGRVRHRVRAQWLRTDPVLAPRRGGGAGWGPPQRRAALHAPPAVRLLAPAPRACVRCWCAPRRTALVLSAPGAFAQRQRPRSRPGEPLLLRAATVRRGGSSRVRCTPPPAPARRPQRGHGAASSGSPYGVSVVRALRAAWPHLAGGAAQRSRPHAVRSPAEAR